MGLYNSRADIDALVEALLSITAGETRGVYDLEAASGDYHPRGWHPDFATFFSVDRKLVGDASPA